MGYSDEDRPARRSARDGGRPERNERAPRGDRAPRGEGRPTRDGARPTRDGDRGYGRQGDSRGAGRPAPRGGREARDEEQTAPRHKEWANTRREVEVERRLSPLIPDEITEKDLEIGIRAQLKTLTPENAEKVARHLAMVGLLIDQDPDLAHQHALAAADRAGRIAVVRETVGCTAYAVGDFTLALRELLTHRRISGSNEQIALIVDSERGLGRPERAIEIGRSVERKDLSAAGRVNLAIAMSGARLDLGQTDLALSELEVPELNPARVFEYSPPLFFAYADVLEDLGRAEESKKWADLGNRAIAALGAGADEDELVTVLEEIEIPVRREWTPEEREARAKAREARENGGFSRGSSGGGFGRGGNRGSGRGGSRGGERSDRSGERGERGSGNFRGDRDGRGERTARPERGDRPVRGDRPARAASDERDSERAARPARSVSRDDYRPKRDK